MDGSTVKLATAGDVKDRLPAFVYGTLQTGFKNHNNTVRGRHSAVCSAHLPGAVVFDFSVGFPGMYPCPGEATSAPTSGTLGSVYPADVLTAVRAQLDAAVAAPSGAVDIAAKGVVGELLFFDEDAGASSPGAGSGGPCSGVGWPAVLADLDRLEDFTAPVHAGNMYERVRVEVLARRSQLPPDVAAASRPAAGVGVAASPEGAAGGAGVTAEPSVSSAAADAVAAGGDSADDWVWVTAWSYFCLIDIRQPSLEATLVTDGNWRRHMAEHRKQDAADDWAAQAGVAPKGSDASAAPAAAPSSVPAVDADVPASGGAASMPA